MIAYIWLGSNLDDPYQQLDRAIQRIQTEDRIKVLRLSSRIETEPYGYIDQPPFVNQVMEIKTDLNCRSLLHLLQEIEDRMGRTREIHWGPRIIDLDILLADDLTIDEPDLQIPHPELPSRFFVLQLLNELIPDHVHQLWEQSIAELYQTFESTGGEPEFSTPKGED
ncbi:MAG: 2-amino-4-hydroxy-6-hydroxymethyldihydropteridine diphosphokinase [Candidatus Cloacimonetes bacterium]|nr:2-amino-4-hydroxy-6-hydroxymethyldihydropteridine diphosphokinase [Candidatus Cloacimonadota bacterium]